MRRLPLVFAGAALCLFAASPLPAGQVRVNVGPTTAFTPQNVTINPGDHVVWVWLGDFHTVTSGTDGSANGDGKFNTIVMNKGAGFTWKSTGPGPFPYYCQPHFFAGMTGTISYGSSVPVTDFRITEVLYNSATQYDQIEIANLGAVTGNLGRYRFATPSDTAIVPLDDFLVPAGGRVRVYVNQSGFQSAPTTLFMPTLLDLNDVAGSLALLTPNTNPATASVFKPDQMIDYLEWGAAGQAYEAVAVAAGLWTAGQFLPTMNYGHSMEFCGLGGNYGKSYWAEVSVPNFGTDGGCNTPTATTTWGRIKTLYR